MNAEKTPPSSVPCLCFALRQASRAVSRLYDEELRGVGLRTTQFSLLQSLRRSGEVRQRDLAERTLHDETSLTRGLRPLVEAGWVAVRVGDDRREKWFRITAQGEAKLAEARRAGNGHRRGSGAAAGGGMGGTDGDPPGGPRLTAET